MHLHNTFTKNLQINGFQITILKDKTGETRTIFNNPTPSTKQKEKILSYLFNEGFIQTPPQKTHQSHMEQTPITTPKIILTLEDGSKETYQLDRSAILAYDPDMKEITISLFGKAHLINHVASVATQEN